MSRTPVIGVLALQGDVREHLATLPPLGAEAVTVKRTQVPQSSEESTSSTRMATSCAV